MGSERTFDTAQLETLPAGPAEVDSGRVAGRFALKSLLGTGGAGAVWAAIDERTGEEVAVKLLDAVDRRRVAAIRQEVNEIVALGHRAVAPLSQALLGATRYSQQQRLVRALARLIGQDPRASAGAATALVNTQAVLTGLLSGTISGAIAALGQEAIPAARETIRVGRQAWELEYGLASMASPDAVELLDALDQRGLLGEMGRSMLLTRTGDARFLERLAQVWKPGDRVLSEELILLAELNGILDPRAALWQADLDAWVAMLEENRRKYGGSSD